MNLALRIATATVDAYFKWAPRSAITREEWQSCRLISHRGCHDGGITRYENTLEAFDVSIQAGIWGIEFDVQWTRDGVPVVIHDPDTARLPGKTSVEIGQVDFDELQTYCSVVPHLESVINRYARKTHMMIELKEETFSRNVIQKLSSMLMNLEPVSDYHLLALQPDILRQLDEYPVESKILVATTNTSEMYTEFKKGGFGGFAGHFFLLNNRIRKQLSSQDLPWGTGFVNSSNALAREIRTGTRWMFSDHAAEVSRSVQRKLNM